MSIIPTLPHENSVDQTEQLHCRWVGDMGAGEWITELVWSEWTAVDANTCESLSLLMQNIVLTRLCITSGQATLAFIRPGGDIDTLTIKTSRTMQGGRAIEVGEIQRVMPGNKRAIKMLRWINASFVWLNPVIPSG
jgi:hypothetical protein